MTCGNSSVGRARPCQGRGREFESRFPLQIKDMRNSGCQFEKFYGALAKRLCSGLQIRLVRFDSGTRLHFLPWPDGGIGRHKGFKIPRRSRCVGSSPAPGTIGIKQNNQSNKQCRETTERWFFCACNLRSNSTQIRLPHLLIPQQLLAAAAQPDLSVNHHIPTVRQL